ncbi:MAG: dihydroorotate dehydrogenase 2 [Candidatus Caldarchaeum sp.]|nr:dihydroorotate dehydrogenase 2 [Candidatus Caldarchaeum sp.]
MFLRLGYGLLRKLPPETAHDLGLKLLPISPYRMNYAEECFTVDTKFGRLKNPVGLAAGFDKHGTHVKDLTKLGFGYIVAGSVTRNFRKGSPKPRIVRREREAALVNAMGFPNPGLEQFLKNIEENRPSETPVVVSVADEKPENLVECYAAVQKNAAAVEINISSPNTPQLRHYFEPSVFRNTAASLAAVKTKPTYLKTPPYATQDDREAVNRVVKIWYENGFDGVTAVNALLVDEPKVAVGRGGLSGRPLFPYMLKCVGDVRELVDEGFEVHAVGGISTGSDVFEAFRNGAKTVQIYTALVYRGPSVVEEILRELKEIMLKRGFDSVEQIRSRR